VSIVGGKSAFVVVRRRFLGVVGFLLIVHLLVLQKRIERGKIGSFDMHCGRSGKLLLAGNNFQNVVGLDRLALGQKPPQCVIDEIKSFMLGGIEQLEVLLDRGSFRRVLEQLVIGHAEPRRGIHVIHILVVDERAWLADQRVDHVAKVDVFLVMAELPRHSLDAFVAVPQFQMVLVNAYFELQTDILAADGIGISLHADDAVGLNRHQDRSAGATPLRRQRAQHRGFFTKAFFSLVVATAD
jgi:hypothetical protein